MIKQFNFYDIYGYLLPGIALLGLLWLPIGVISKSWPDQDFSKAIFIAFLAYFLGHILQSIATNAVPSKIMYDRRNRSRYPSDYLLDASASELSSDFKIRLAQQVRDKFRIDLRIEEDGDGAGSLLSDRNTAFFQARSFLIAKKTAHYVEQFEGLYAMMRGLACALLAGTCYLVGWALAFDRASTFIQVLAAIVGILGLVIALISSFRSLSRDREVMRRSVVRLAFALLAVIGAAGFWTGEWQPATFWSGASSHEELILLAAVPLSLILAARCYSAYRVFAVHFAQSVWRDFSVYLTVQDAAATESSGGEPDEEDNE